MTNERFYLEFCKMDSVFLYQVYLLNYKNCFYICKGTYLCHLRQRELKKKLKYDLE